MPKFDIRYGLGGGFGGCGDWETIEAINLDVALDEAWGKAVEVYESYEGSNGIRSVVDIADEEFLSETEAEEVYNDERESLLDYEARAHVEGFDADD